MNARLLDAGVQPRPKPVLHLRPHESHEGNKSVFCVGRRPHDTAKADRSITIVRTLTGSRHPRGRAYGRPVRSSTRSPAGGVHDALHYPASIQ